MARRRMIDPNIWQSEDFSKLSLLAKLLFIGMFSIADDEGKGRGKPIYLKSVIFPYDDGMRLIDVEKALSEIGSNMSVTFYAHDESVYYKLSNWSKWQKVDKPQPSKIPNPDGNTESISHISFYDDDDDYVENGEENTLESFQNADSSVTAAAENGSVPAFEPFSTNSRLIREPFATNSRTIREPFATNSRLKEKNIKEKKRKEKEENTVASSDASVSASISKKARSAYKWVKLSDQELTKLVTEFGFDTTCFYIAFLDEYVQGNGNKNKYKDWYLALRNAIKGKWGTGKDPLTHNAIREQLKEFATIQQQPPSDSATVEIDPSTLTGAARIEHWLKAEAKAKEADFQKRMEAKRALATPLLDDEEA